jgi:hypothetical protein
MFVRTGRSALLVILGLAMKRHLVLLSMILLIPSFSQLSEAWMSSKFRKPTRSFLVMTNAGFTGNLGGLAGANNACLNDLTTYNWVGKGDAVLTPSTVKAFLCDSSTCQDLKPTTRYFFAVSGYTSYGGGSFVSSPSNAGPGDTTPWDSNQYFGSGQTWGYWTGRATGTSTLWPTGTGGVDLSCSGWTTTAGGTKGIAGAMANTGSLRWNFNQYTCSTGFSLLCIVDAP